MPGQPGFLTAYERGQKNLPAPGPALLNAAAIPMRANTFDFSSSRYESMDVFNAADSIYSVE
eukprot:21672-Eustigmatos_ZCMA.PRE.1